MFRTFSTLSNTNPSCNTVKKEILYVLIANMEMSHRFYIVAEKECSDILKVSFHICNRRLEDKCSLQ